MRKALVGLQRAILQKLRRQRTGIGVRNDLGPEATVVQSFIEIVETLGQMVRFLPLPTKGRDPISVVRELARLGYIDQKSVSLFVNLRDAYTAAVREGYVRLSAEEAVSYLAAAHVLNTQLREVLRRREDWWADVLADPRARKQQRRTDLAVKQAYYRLADEKRETILVASSKCDWRAAFSPDELIASHGADYERRS